MSVKNSFAIRLKQLREEKGLSQTQMAEALGISRGSISFYENEERTPDIETLDNVAHYFNVPIEYLMGYVNAKNVENNLVVKELGLSDNTINVLRDTYKDTPYVIELLNDLFDDNMAKSCNLHYLLFSSFFYVTSQSEDMNYQMLLNIERNGTKTDADLRDSAKAFAENIIKNNFTKMLEDLKTSEKYRLLSDKCKEDNKRARERML